MCSHPSAQGTATRAWATVSLCCTAASLRSAKNSTRPPGTRVTPDTERSGTHTVTSSQVIRQRHCESFRARTSCSIASKKARYGVTVGSVHAAMWRRPAEQRAGSKRRTNPSIRPMHKSVSATNHPSMPTAIVACGDDPAARCHPQRLHRSLTFGRERRKSRDVTGRRRRRASAVGLRPLRLQVSDHGQRTVPNLTHQHTPIPSSINATTYPKASTDDCFLSNASAS